MAQNYRLPAQARLQVWSKGVPVDARHPFLFDAHDAMIGLHHDTFRAMANDILHGDGNRCNELAAASATVQTWFLSSVENTYLIEVSREDFRGWLDLIGLDEFHALTMDKSGSEELMHIAEFVSAPAPAAPHMAF